MVLLVSAPGKLFSISLPVLTVCPDAGKPHFNNNNIKGNKSAYFFILMKQDPFPDP